jgi:hypothetical protein
VPWFPEASSPAVPFYDGILQASPEDLAGSWASGPWLDDPRVGRIADRAGFEEWAIATRGWLEEVAIDLSVDAERRELPVAIAADHTSGGRLTAIRIYHSLWPLTGEHRIRQPMLEGDPGLEGPDVVGDYQRALAAGDLEAALDAYEDDAIVREPAGGPYVYRGKESLRRIYKLQFANGGGIPLERCQITDDGAACALEYNVVRWGVADLPPQAGLAVYGRGRTGKLAFGRIYDDAAPPAASDSSERTA